MGRSGCACAEGLTKSAFYKVEGSRQNDAKKGLAVPRCCGSQVLRFPGEKQGEMALEKQG